MVKFNDILFVPRVRQIKCPYFSLGFRSYSHSYLTLSARCMCCNICRSILRKEENWHNQCQSCFLQIKGMKTIRDVYCRMLQVLFVAELNCKLNNYCTCFVFALFFGYCMYGTFYPEPCNFYMVVKVTLNHVISTWW